MLRFHPLKYFSAHIYHLQDCVPLWAATEQHSLEQPANIYLLMGKAGIRTETLRLTCGGVYHQHWLISSAN